MTDQSQGAGAGSGAGSSQGSQSGGDLHPAFNPVSKPAAPPPEYSRSGIPENPRSRGHGAALDAARGRQQQQPPGTPGEQQRGSDQGQQQPSAPDKITIDGAEFSHAELKSALAHKVESDARHASLPDAPDKYDVKLPPDFKAPEGVNFEFNLNDPMLKSARELAHKRGLDQESFSDFLGVYAATQIGQHQVLAQARAAELAKLGTAAQQRIDAIDVWMRARIGNKGELLVKQLRAYPVASIVEAMEGLVHQFGSQGGADYSQSGRQQEDNTGKIPGYENMSFSQKRAAQDAARGRGR